MIKSFVLFISVQVKKNSSPPLSLYGQLLWREFFYTAATNNPRFDKMEGNPICVRIPWDKNPEALAKWAEAKTGFPWIDAIMTQLRQEGWIHHLARHAVACFLTRGDLWISWEEGMKVTIKRVLVIKNNKALGKIIFLQTVSTPTLTVSELSQPLIFFMSDDETVAVEVRCEEVVLDTSQETPGNKLRHAPQIT